MHMRQTSSTANQALRLYGRSNEPGENVKQGKMKQTVWSISCSTSWISNSSSELQWKSWLTCGGRGQNGGWEKRWGIRWGRALGFSQKHTSEIFNLALINSCLFQAQIELSYMATPLCWGLLHALQEIWFIHLAYCWRWLEHSPESSPENWFLTIHDSPPRVPRSSLTLLQINLKAEPDSSSHRTPYKQPLFLQKALFVLYGGFKANTSLLRRATV